MGNRKRLERQAGRQALVDGIPFHLPVNSEQSPALMAAFPLDADRARSVLPGNELHPVRFRGKGILLITVIDYRVTDIGKYIEYSIAIACTHGRRPVPTPLAVLMPKRFGIGQFVLDLPVSTEISVKGGKGIWGMPKHRASLDFVIGEDWVTSRYDLDGQLAMQIEVRPRRAWLPMSMGAVNYCQFRGMLMKSYIYFKGKIGFSLFSPGSARLAIGDHPRLRGLAGMGVEADRPLFAGFFPETRGMLDDHFECWFLSHDRAPTEAPEGLESVFWLGLSQEWPPPPGAVSAPAGTALPPAADRERTAAP
ncbi:MAG: acetoacetate decarboxylase family protein [Gemmatimonadota bacterium]|nr:acetoacetate decarboxylase family protein [Gemmatimonadota bacterium]